MKIITVVGARPQFIKAAALQRAFRRHERDIHHLLVHTGQHYDADMSDIFFEELQIQKPDYHLGVGGGSHGAMTGKMLEKIEEVLIQEHPDWVMVYGDTNSTLAGALSAVKMHIPVAHVEAGLRSFNRRMPEEINRILTDHASDLLFTPTKAATEQLMKEGIAPDHIRLVGDVMYDVAKMWSQEGGQQILSRQRLQPHAYVLATIHRAENTDDVGRLREIFQGLVLLSDSLPVVVPLHPRTRAALVKASSWDSISGRLHILEPQGYREMAALEASAALLVTDSGGVQKEAYFFRVPCVTVRDETEWRELVDAGVNTLCKADRGAVLQACRTMMQRSCDFSKTLYGDGDAAEHIVEALLQWKR